MSPSRKASPERSAKGGSPQPTGKKSQIELEWAKRSMAHAEVYAKLLTDFDGAKLHLTQHDDAILASFKQEFPEIDVSDVLKGGDHFNSTEAKAKWTKWIGSWSSKITDAQYGTLLRVRSNGDYSEDNIIFVLRAQWYAVEIARNKAGLNTMHYEPATAKSPAKKQEKASSATNGQNGHVKA